MVDTQKIVDDTFIETMSEMGFVDVIQLKEGSVIIDPVAIRIGIMMPYLGDVVVIFSRPLALKFTMNLTIDSASDSLEQGITDASCEFVNVFVGKLIEKMYPDILFELGLPSRIEVNKFNKDGYVAHYYTDPERQSVALYRKFLTLKKS